MSSAVVSFSDRTLMQLFKRSHHGARGSLSTPLPLFFDFSISFFSMFAFPSGLGKVWIGLWCLPERKRTFNFRPGSRNEGCQHGRHGWNESTAYAVLWFRRPCSGGAQHVRHPRMQRAPGRKFLAF